MWNRDKSAKLTLIIVRLCYVLLALAVVAVPIYFKTELNIFYSVLGGETAKNESALVIIAPFYSVVPAGYCALICLDKLLVNIKKEFVFCSENVRLMRIIGWRCFYAGFVGTFSFILAYLCRGIMPVLFIILACGEFFMGLILRVVKNTFDAAIKLKEENDLTI
ncbi:MAG: DUF2975 domain-containing protein [Clostridiales bacterium]|nr:DUF2975 domain-containing protein [Clostridiales bacterium]